MSVSQDQCQGSEIARYLIDRLTYCCQTSSNLSVQVIPFLLHLPKRVLLQEKLFSSFFYNLKITSIINILEERSRLIQGFTIKIETGVFFRFLFKMQMKIISRKEKN